ncbi:hypothetical protein Tco_1465980 [Tanacetum coccineum]
MSWFSRCSWCEGPFNSGNYRQCTNVSFGDEFVRNPDLISNDETPDFSYPPSQPQTYSFDQFHCFGCGDPLEDGPSRRFNSIYFDDDDKEERTIPLNEFFPQIPPSIAITLVLPIEDSKESLIIGDENLSTIPEKESDEFIKSSVEDLVPILSESEDTSDNDSEIYLPFCDNSMTFSNLLFNDNDAFSSSDDESLPEELEDIESEDSYVSKLDDPDLLVTPLSKRNEDKCFDLGGDFLLNDDPSSPLPPKELNFEELKVIKSDVSTDFEDNYYDSEGDIIYLESLLIKDTIPNLPPEVFLDDDPRSLEDEPNKDDLKYIVKVFDPGIWKKFFSPTYVKLPFEDHHYLSLTYVIRIFLPYFTYPVDSSLPLFSGSEDTIFDPDISAFHFSSLELMDCPSYEDSRARGFVHRSLKL